jgi:glycerophosphoryl diester phosphodiesterase
MPSDQGGIFISYRRGETAWPARQLYEVLVCRFGAGSVFKDVDDIEPGEDFVEKITEAVAGCDVLLALIGPHWLTMTNSTGVRRLDDPNDFVRLELAAALTRGVRVVPILVDGATMPNPDDLPPDLAPITRRQAVEINPVGFNTERLMTTLSALLGRSATVTDAAAIEATATADAAPPAASVERAAVPPAVTEVSAAEAPLAAEPTEAPVPSEPPEPSVVSAPSVSSFTTPPQPPRGGAVTTPASTPHRRMPLLIGAGAVALALIAGVVVWHPWTAQPTSATPAASTLPPTPSVLGSGPSTPASEAPSDLQNPPILAHRGGFEQHQLETMQAMADAARRGFAVETDIRYTSDGVAVLVHDEAATKGLDCGGTDVQVSKTTWADLREKCRSRPTANDDQSYEIPTLDATLEAVAAASPTSWLFLEIKTNESDARLKRLLGTPAAYGLSDRTVWTAFSRDRLLTVRSLDKTTRRMLFVQGKQVPAATIAKDGLWGVAVEHTIADADYVKSLQAAGLRVVLWTVNDPKAWAAVAPWGADLLMTDTPTKYQQWLANR